MKLGILLLIVLICVIFYYFIKDYECFCCNQTAEGFGRDPLAGSLTSPSKGCCSSSKLDPKYWIFGNNPKTENDGLVALMHRDWVKK